MAHTSETGTAAPVREIDVYCTAHSLSFSVPAAARLLCGHNGHELDQAFPRGTFWEYCCDCQTFVQCEIAKERKADESCPSCDRQFARRFVCDKCHVISCESDEAARRKLFSFGTGGTPPPTCPGCLTPTAPLPLKHDCEDFGFSFLTARKECPFCRDAVSPRPDDAPAAPAAGPACPKCGAAVKPHFKFCKKCRTPLQTQPAAPAPPPPAAPGPPPTTPQPDPTVSETAAGPPSLTGPLPQIGDGPAPRASGGKKLLIGVAVAVLVAGALLMMAAYRASSSSFSTESKLENAIAKGNLVSPAGDSAQHYYNLLRSEGARPDALDRHAARLLPLLTARPFKMLEDLAIPGKNDSSPTEWEEASRLLAWAAELSPQDKSLAARAVYSTGRAAYTRQQTDAALEQWTRAAELDPKWAAPVNGVGLIYNERKQYETARKYLRDAIRRDPNWAVPYNNMGTSYFYERSYDQAAEYYQKAASLAPQWARPHAWLGDIAYERKDFCTARQEYQTALDFAAPGMNNWNPERIQSKRDSAAAKCAQPVSSDAGRERITFGLGGTAASLRGYTSGTNSYVISALANQNMNVWLAADSGSPALRVFDSAMNPLSTGEGLTSWSGTLPYSGDYNILVTSAGGGAAYTLHVTIPPRG